jgi:GT2 family glycosyltransferase
MVVRREALEEVGLFDRQFWMYGEDLDWCKRFAEAGWPILYDGSVTATHLKGASSGGRRPLVLDWHFHRSMQLYYRKHMGQSPRLVRFAVGAGIWSEFALSVLGGLLRRLGRSPAATRG